MKWPRKCFLIGTSGWSYPHWYKVFYPEDWPKSRWFEYYAQEFPAVEVNATFYRRFKDQTYVKWRDRAPGGFFYVLKAPRLITHRKYLRGVGEEITDFWRSASLLEEKLGLILLQLAPSTRYDIGLLREALLAFPEPRKLAVEFRHQRWLTPETMSLLEETEAVFCCAESPKLHLLDWVTSQTAYIRLHGRKSWYAYDYSAEELQEIAAFTRRVNRRGAKRVYVFFNNDHEGNAPRNAKMFLNMLR
jgi:uncharacterized protein YecE (DUF72 family)